MVSAFEKIFGWFLRLPLRLIPANARMRILAPKELRGKKWIRGAGIHSVWLGRYERRKRSLFSQHVRRGSTVYDIGAQAGFYSLLAAQLVGRDGHVVAFEPLDRNLANLRRHLSLNSISNVTVMAAAVGDRVGRARFLSEETGYMGSLDESGDVEVIVTTVDEVAVSRGDTVDVIKLDVEGAEARVLAGSLNTLRRDRPIVFLATHGADAHSTSCSMLTESGYQLVPIDAPSIDVAREILAVSAEA